MHDWLSFLPEKKLGEMSNETKVKNLTQRYKKALFIREQWKRFEKEQAKGLVDEALENCQEEHVAQAFCSRATFFKWYHRILQLCEYPRYKAFFDGDDDDEVYELFGVKVARNKISGEMLKKAVVDMKLQVQEEQEEKVDQEEEEEEEESGQSSEVETPLKKKARTRSATAATLQKVSKVDKNKKVTPVKKSPNMRSK